MQKDQKQALAKRLQKNLENAFGILSVSERQWKQLFPRGTDFYDKVIEPLNSLMDSLDVEVESLEIQTGKLD